jgi:hypothetical protein
MAVENPLSPTDSRPNLIPKVRWNGHERSNSRRGRSRTHNDSRTTPQWLAQLPSGQALPDSGSGPGRYETVGRSRPGITARHGRWPFGRHSTKLTTCQSCQFRNCHAMKTPPDLQTVLLRVPDDLPCYQEWDFKVWPGEFALFKEALISELIRLIKEDRRHYIAMWIFGAGWLREYKTHIRLRKLLDNADAESLENLEDYRLTVWSIAEPLIYSQEFRHFMCPPCNRTFAPGDGHVEEWTSGEDLGEFGGRRFLCPSGHTLYAITEWNT